MNNIISSFYKNLNKRPELRSIIPIGYNPGIPMFSIKEDNLCLMVPYLRYKITGEKDKTLVFPIRYVVEYLVPEYQLIRFEDLAYSQIANKIDFDKPCGYFRHKAIENITQEEYQSLRNNTLYSFDKVADVLLNGQQYTITDKNTMACQLQKIVEPSLWGFYRFLSPDFFNKYFANGKD